MSMKSLVVCSCNGIHPYDSHVLTPFPDEEGNTSTRSLGLLVARGTLLVLISPVDGSEEIENPFVQNEDDE